MLLPNGDIRQATVVLYNPTSIWPCSRCLASAKAAALRQRDRWQQGRCFWPPERPDPLAVQPAQLAEEVTAMGEDLYNNKSTQRDVFILAANLTYGDSGAPVVSTSGKVVGVAFAIAPDRPTTAYALSTSNWSRCYRSPTGRRRPRRASTA